MKIRFSKNVILDQYNPKLDEYWDKSYYRYDELVVDKTLAVHRGQSDLLLENGIVLYNVPNDSFETI